jgi:hypothetical protein
MTTRILILLFISAFFASCSSSGKVNNDAGAKRLIFGNGGGFTGMYTSYELNEDGRLFSLLADSVQHQVKKLRKKQTSEIFAQADKLKMTQPAFNHPGNMTSFIRYKSGGVLTEYSWGDPGISVPAEITNLYSQLNSIVK